MDRRVITFFVVTFGAIILMSAVKTWLFPPVPVPTQPSVAAVKPAEPAKPLAKPHPEAVGLAAAQALGQPGGQLLHPLPDAEAARLFDLQAKAAKAEADRKAQAAVWAKQPDPFQVLGNDKVQVTFSERGAAVKSVTLLSYRTATRDYARPDPELRPLRLLSDDDDGKLATLDPVKRVERQSFRFTIPETELAWKLKEKQADKLVFEAEAPAKNLRVTKTFTLKRDVYHVQMELAFAPLDPAVKSEFIYEVGGPYGLEVEGIHWKQTTFRQATTCGLDPKDPRQATRFLDDALTTDPKRAGANVRGPHLFNDPKADLVFQFTGVMNQFFAALIVAEHDEEPLPPRLVDKVQNSYAGDDEDVPPYQQKFQGKMATKLVSLPVKLEGKPVSHRYFLFTGPCKTLLLGFEEGTAPGLEQFYTQQHHLRMLTEAPLDNPISRFSYAIGWSSLVVYMTNLMHRLLEFLHSIFGYYGLAILAMTLIVRALMFPISRKQAQNAKDMADKMAKMKPEQKKLEERYKNDPQGKAAAQMELMRKHGVNPLSSCTGCLIVLLQMPIFMGLYYALNESTHLRLSSFLWFPNLAAPDMLLQWNAWPVFSSLARGLNLVLFTLTLGDFFNLLPLISVGLMYFQQKMMMPPALDEQQAMQQKMMNYMMFLMGYMFYWVASGLCLYFIVSSAWGMLERKLLPKKPAETEAPAGKPGKPTDKAKGTAAESGLAQKAGDLWKKLLKEADKK